MSTYYKHTRVEDANIPYSFQCESCMKNSGDLKAYIVGDTATYNSNFKTLSAEREVKLQEEAHDNLVKKLKEIHKDVKEKEVYATEFKDECPHCHKPQSWAVSGLKKKRFDTPIVIFGVGVIIFIIGLIGYFTEKIEYLTLPMTFAILGVAFVCAAISFIWNTIKINKKIKETSTSGTKNIPSINWEEVQ